MKIGLLLSGQLGKFFYGSDTDKISVKWKKIVEKYNIDVFCVTDDNNYYHDIYDSQIFSEYNNDMHVTNVNSWRYYKNKKILDYDTSCKYLDNNLKKCFENNIKNIIILKDGSLNNDKLIKNTNHKIFLNYKSTRGDFEKIGLLNQYYKLQECFNSLLYYEQSNNFSYDIIIRCRFDCIIESLIEQINIYELDLLKNIYSSKYEHYINDWWCIGNRYIMEKYCNYYTNFSQNIIDGYELYLYHDNGKIIGYDKGINIIEKKIPFYNISDSAEFGLTYIILIIEKYNCINNLHFIIDKSYQ